MLITPPQGTIGGVRRVYDVTLPASTPPHPFATLRPFIDKLCKAENILKTKGRNRDFSFAKAENMLKKIHLQDAMKIHKKHDIVSD